MSCPGMEGLPAQALHLVAAYFQALAEPTRLRILNLLRGGERRAGDLARLAGCTAANMSRHLALLAQQGLVERDSRGTSVYYRIADPSVYDLCDLVCSRIAREIERTAGLRRPFARTPARPRVR